MSLAGDWGRRPQRIPTLERNIMELKNAVINILGDSITEGVGASCEENRLCS